jgi:hypothetical protein
VVRLPIWLLTGALMAAAALAWASSPQPVPASDDGEAGAAVPLATTFASPEAAVEAALAALAAEDVAALRALAVTRDEFRDFVWSGLDASRPERNLTWEFVWSQHAMKHERGLQRAVALFGGTELELDSVELVGRVSEHTGDHQSFSIHRESRVHVIAPDGEHRTIQLFGSMLSTAGRYKIYSFITD